MQHTSTPLLEDTLCALKSSRWAFEALLPRLRSALSERAEVSDMACRSTFGLCLEAFADRRLSSAERDYDSHGDRPLVIGGDRLTDDQHRLWKHVLRTLAPQDRKAHVTTDERLIQRLRRAIDWLADKDAISYDALRRHVDYVCCIGGVDFTSSSHPQCFGVLFVNPKPTLTTDELAVILVHEMAHQELFLVNTQDRLVRPESDEEMVHAPLQGRPRPTIGRLHAAHALWRMLDAELRMDHHHVPGLRRDLSETLATFARTGLTGFGSRLIAEVHAAALEGSC